MKVAVDGRSIGFRSAFPRGRQPCVLYLMGGLKANANLLAKLGPHKVGGGCLYVPRLEGIDTKVLARLIRLSHKGNRQVAKRVSTRATARKRPV